MQSQDNENTSNRPSFEKYRDPKSLGRKSNKVTSILKCDAHHHQITMRRLRKISYSRLKKQKSVPHSDFPSSPRIKRTYFHCDNSSACNSKFKKREITTIHEEIIHFKSKSHSSRKFEKAHKDKVASLKNIVKRLREMGVAKSEKLPEDVTQQFSCIKL